MAIELYWGSMKSGKTKRAIEEAKKAKKYGWSKISAYKPTTDTRSGFGWIHSYDGNKKIPATEILPNESFRIVEDVQRDGQVDIIVISEVQFFDMSICKTVVELHELDKTVIVEGLLLDHQGRPFGPTASILAMAGRKEESFAVCECKHGSHEKSVCGKRYAVFSALRPNVKIENGQVVIVGRKNFLVMCRYCFFEHLECRYVEPGMRDFFIERGELVGKRN
ncbi:MAG: hypothetical protein M1338_03280 [Patescibacteria group bacterium]|nr:hypothetical protein [Patescibacteria group bacterium]